MCVCTHVKTNQTFVSFNTVGMQLPRDKIARFPTGTGVRIDNCEFDACRFEKFRFIPGYNALFVEVILFK